LRLATTIHWRSVVAIDTFDVILIRHFFLIVPFMHISAGHRNIDFLLMIRGRAITETNQHANAKKWTSGALAPFFRMEPMNRVNKTKEPTMTKSWVAVLSQSQMKLFGRVDGEDSLEFIKSLENELARLKSKDVSRHEPGKGIRGSAHRGDGQYSMTSSSETPHEITSDAFALQIANFLDDERKQGHVSDVTITAEPKFMGRVKKAMTDETKKIVLKWIGKDLEKATTDIITEVVNKPDLALEEASS
jgi:protein required for attachment to host cells